MIALFLAFATTTFALLLALAAWEVVADRWAAYQDGARRALEPDSFADVKALPETTAFDPPEDVVRQRLHLVAPSNVVSIPRQRQPYDVESEGL